MLSGLSSLGYVGVVRDSAEFRRVRDLPRRVHPPDWAGRLTALFRQPGSAQELWPVQAQALAEIALCGGLVGLIRVGAGKTLITYLAAEMLEVKRPLLVVPAKLLLKTCREFRDLARDWRTSRTLAIQTYERLGRVQGATFLDDLLPDLIICDEAHKVRHVTAAVTKRVGRYMSEHPGTHFVALSGTLTGRSLRDFAHMAEWALGDGVPLPRRWEDLLEWCGAVDAEPATGRYQPGVLEEFCNAGEDVRDGFRRRLTQTLGVVATESRGVDAGLTLYEWWSDFQHTDEVAAAFEGLREEWVMPDGVALISAVDVWRAATTLALGFYYRWVPDPPPEWLKARRRWSAFVRNTLSRSRTLDSPLQVAMRYPDDPRLREWLRVQDQYQFSVEARWLDTRVVEQAACWAVENNGIVWTNLVAVGEELDRLGVLYYSDMGQNRYGQAIENARGGIAASIEANKEGRNLQHYNQNLVLTPPTTGTAWEQLLGRTHREGQKADEVSVEIFFGCTEHVNAFQQAKRDARYQQQVTGSPQKLLTATTAFGGKHHEFVQADG